MRPIRLTFAGLIAGVFLGLGCGEGTQIDHDSGRIRVYPGMAAIDAGQTNAAERPDASFNPIDSGVERPDSGVAACSDTWNSYAQAFMSANCTRCHAAFSSYGSVSADSNRIRANVSSGFMPRGGFLSQQERTRFISWIDCGMPM